MTNHNKQSNWQHMNPALAPRAHHVDDMIREAADYHLTRDSLRGRRQQRLANIRARIGRVVLPAGRRARREARSPATD